MLLAAGAPVHLALSLGWAGVLGAVLPARAEPLHGDARRARDRRRSTSPCSAASSRRSRALPQGRQWADHAAFGLSVGLVLRATRRAGRRPAPGARLDDRARRRRAARRSRSSREPWTAASRPSGFAPGGEQERARARRRRARPRATSSEPCGEPPTTPLKSAPKSSTTSGSAVARSISASCWSQSSSRGTTGGRSPRAIAAIARSSKSTSVRAPSSASTRGRPSSRLRRTACW